MNKHTNCLEFMKPKLQEGGTSMQNELSGVLSVMQDE
jgi:hypothetical protein